MNLDVSESLAQVDVAALLDCLPDPAIIIDESYRILASNDAYRRKYLGGRPVRGHHCFEMSHRRAVPCDQAGEICPVQRSIEQGEMARATHLHHTPRGEQLEEVTTYPIARSGSHKREFLEVIRPVRIASATKNASGLAGNSLAFRQMIDMIMRVAPRDTTVLLLGESGTGKELAAKAIHEASTRASKKLVPVDSSGLSETLFESELFGHEKGAFTGASTRKLGLVEICNGGTLFLDEIGDIPLQLQVKLLRLIETGLFRRVGSAELRSSDFRLVCATHRDLVAMVEDGTFRRDLYYRISAFPIRIPPLRERIDDMALLAENFGERLGCRRLKSLDPDVLEALRRYDFPGNVRELRNLLERACLLADGGGIRLEHFPREIRNRVSAEPEAPAGAQLVSLDERERQYLAWAAATFPGSRRELARKLGISERTLYRKLRLAGLNLNGSSRQI